MAPSNLVVTWLLDPWEYHTITCSPIKHVSLIKYIKNIFICSRQNTFDPSKIFQGIQIINLKVYRQILFEFMDTSMINMVMPYFQIDKLIN